MLFNHTFRWHARGPWRGKMGTRICLFLHWENGMWVTGTEICVMPLGLGAPNTKLGMGNMFIYSISTEIYSLQSRWIKTVLHWKEAISLVIRFFSLVKNIAWPIRSLIRFFSPVKKFVSIFPPLQFCSSLHGLMALINWKLKSLFQNRSSKNHQIW